MKRFVIKTLGCKVNQAESENMAASFRHEGFLALASDATWSPCDTDRNRVSVCVINTCTVTEKASTQSRQAIRQAIRAYPNARIIVTGCYAKIHPEEIMKIEGVSDILPQEEKQSVTAAVMSRFSAPALPAPASTQWPDAISFTAEEARGERTRAFLKMQDGCNAHCTYCIVPKARGRSRSMPEAQVISNLQALHRAGYKEVVLSGIHLGCYGLDFSPPVPFVTMLEHIDRRVGIPRLRLSSIEPGEISDDIIDLVARSDNFCRHFHIPLQSGDDDILRRMGRSYTRSFFGDLVRRIRGKIPDAAIGVDVLVGFPGESDTAFRNTYDLIESLPLTYLHVFPFSPRKQTPAYDMPDRVPVSELKSRAAEIRILGDTKRLAFFKTFVGQTLDVLVEEGVDGASGLFRGRTSNYVPVYLKNYAGGKNAFVSVQIESCLGNRGVLAVPISSPSGA